MCVPFSVLQENTTSLQNKTNSASKLSQITWESFYTSTRKHTALKIKSTWHVSQKVRDHAITFCEILKCVLLSFLRHRFFSPPSLFYWRLTTFAYNKQQLLIMFKSYFIHNFNFIEKRSVSTVNLQKASSACSLLLSPPEDAKVTSFPLLGCYFSHSTFSFKRAS